MAVVLPPEFRVEGDAAWLEGDVRRGLSCEVGYSPDNPPSVLLFMEHRGGEHLGISRGIVDVGREGDGSRTRRCVADDDVRILVEAAAAPVPPSIVTVQRSIGREPSGYGAFRGA